MFCDPKENNENEKMERKKRDVWKANSRKTNEKKSRENVISSGKKIYLMTEW